MGKSIGRNAYGQNSTLLKPRVKALLAKARQLNPTRYLIVQVNPELANISEQMQPIAKVETAKAFFAKYRIIK